MTTSFTTSEEFEPQGGGFDEPDYPELFGITLTPTVSGIAIGVGGLLIAAYLAWSQVLPTWQDLSKLKEQRETKQQQLDQINSQQLDVIIVRKKAELEEMQTLKQDVMQLFTNEENLETLLLDVSSFANLSNIQMNSYVPSGEKQVLADDSLGSLATNNVQVKTYNLDVEGTFPQLQLFLQDLERLQPLLVIKNLNTSTVEPPTYLFENNKLLNVGKPTLKTTVTVQAVFADVKAQPASTSPEGQ